MLLFSALSNLLMLTGSIFMLEVYDRVLPSRSTATLFALALIALFLFAVQGILDAMRSRILVRIGAVMDTSLNGRVHDAVLHTAGRSDRAVGLQPMRDLDAVRSFLSGPGPGALLDLPWLPFYLLIIFMFHPVLGVTALMGTIILVIITLLTELHSRGHVKQATSELAARTAIIETSRRNAEVIAAMGMGQRQAERFSEASETLVKRQNSLSDVTGGLGALARSSRMILQSAMLGVGAWLVIHGEASAGIIIAGSILVSRALAPVDQAISQWRNFAAARQGWTRLAKLLEAVPPEPHKLPLPRPRTGIQVETLAVADPSGTRVLVRDVSFELPAGSGLAVLGSSGSGKSTLARALVGAWPAAAGKVRLDGASLDQWPSALLGRHIGYLPQDVELFAGTVAENISRLDPDAAPEKVIAAAQAAGCHELIVRLRQGYQTQIGEGGAVLSAGQRQRVALARALYRDPFLVVLDEPNSNLDQEGDKALLSAIHGVRERGGIAIVISHRPNCLEALDFVLIMHQGRPIAFGPRDPVIAKFFPALLKPASGGDAQAFPRKPLPVDNVSVLRAQPSRRLPEQAQGTKP
ncbi:type I secretion system permease/ATPase [Aestuariivirga sp.]|uniref:type I secretion system permease/ATPase n=1 Tax=Aestuariivirga sp. TaxID=2650926 RepID=UPI00391C5D33